LSEQKPTLNGELSTAGDFPAGGLRNAGVEAGVLRLDMLEHQCQRILFILNGPTNMKSIIAIFIFRAPAGPMPPAGKHTCSAQEQASNHYRRKNKTSFQSGVYRISLLRDNS